MIAFHPGVYPEIPEEDYHSGAFGPTEGSLSSTEARRILDAPAILHYYREHPEPPKEVFDLGHVVHALVLGTGLDIYVHDWPDFRTQAAREDVKEARENGKVPVKRSQFDEMRTVADSVLTDPVAGPIFEMGTPEQSIYGVDEETGVWMRGRVDWTQWKDGRTTLVDLKTATTAIPSQWARRAADLDYAIQREYYRQIWTNATGQEDPRFLHVVVDKNPPHLVAVVEMDYDFESVGKAKVRRALDLYKRCVDTDSWPGLPPIIHRLAPPIWYVAAEEELEAEIEVH